MMGWFSRFILEFSVLKEPLYRLTKKGVLFEWGPEQQTAFDALKDALCRAPVIIRPDFDKEFLLHTDASDYAIGAVLCQEDEEELQHPIVFISRLLYSAERKWTTTKKECLAVIWAVERLRAYLEGYPVTVFTDHGSLTWLPTGIWQVGHETPGT